MDHFYPVLSLLVWWTPLFLLTYVAYTSNFFQNAFNQIKSTCRNLKTLRNLVATRHKNPVRIIIVTAFTALKSCGVMIFKACWINFLQYINNTVVQEGRVFCVTYVIKGKLYKIKVVPERGPEKIMQIIDDGYNDVTEEISPYLRAQRSMIHHFSPKDFGKENIQILTADDDDPFNFNEHEKIILKEEEPKLSSLSNPVLSSSEKSIELSDPLQNIMNEALNFLTVMQKNPQKQKFVPQKTE